MLALEDKTWLDTARWIGRLPIGGTRGPKLALLTSPVEAICCPDPGPWAVKSRFVHGTREKRPQSRRMGAPTGVGSLFGWSSRVSGDFAGSTSSALEHCRLKRVAICAARVRRWLFCCWGAYLARQSSSYSMEAADMKGCPQLVNLCWFVHGRPGGRHVDCGTSRLVRGTVRRSSLLDMSLTSTAGI